MKSGEGITLIKGMISGGNHNHDESMLILKIMYAVLNFVHIDGLEIDQEHVKHAYILAVEILNCKECS